MIGMRSKVRVMDDRRWVIGRIIGIIFGPEGITYDVAVDKPFGEPKSILSQKEKDIQLVEEAGEIDCIRLSPRDPWMQKEAVFLIADSPCNDN